jgi:hypothetical protein
MPEMTCRHQVARDASRRRVRRLIIDRTTDASTSAATMSGISINSPPLVPKVSASIAIPRKALLAF